LHKIKIIRQNVVYVNNLSYFWRVIIDIPQVCKPKEGIIRNTLEPNKKLIFWLLNYLFELNFVFEKRLTYLQQRNNITMKRTIFTTFSILIATILFSQTNEEKKNGFANFNEFIQNQPSLSYEFQLKKRTDGDIFMTGGIVNYRLKKIKPEKESSKVEKEIWGITVNDTVYINSYPFSRMKGYNPILEKGYYSYFIGEPAWNEKEQRELGIIKPTDKKIAVCCKVGYVILPDGTVQFLRPELLLELCKDNKELVYEIKAANLEIKDVERMFGYLSRYNSLKK